MAVWIAVVVVVGTLVLGSVVYIVIARRAPEGGRGDRTPTNVYAVTAGAMSLLIAFTMSMAFGQYSQAQQAAQQEADAVIALSRASTFMEPTVRDALRNQLVCYGQDVITLEWPSMRSGSQDSAPEASQTLWHMDSIIAANMSAAGPGLGMWESATQARSTAREQRLLLAGAVVPPLLWFLLIFGSLITIGSLFVFADRTKPAWGHILVVIGPLFVASAALVVIAFFDHQYADAAGGVTSRAMEKTMYILTHEKMGNIPLPSCPTDDGQP